MAVLTGADGQLKYKEKTVAKCREWSIGISKAALDCSSLGDLDRNYVEGIRGTTGSATLLYDPSENQGKALINSVFSNGASDDVSFVLNKADGTEFRCNGFITSVSPSVSVGSVQAVSVSFQVNGKPDGSF